MRIVGVTGTNGKSTVVSFTRQLLEGAGADAWSLGTFGLVGPFENDPEPFFVRGPGGLRRFLERAIPSGPNVVVVVEAYSVALASGDWEGIRADAVAFTSLGRDHLDVHGSLATYRAAKMRLLRRYARFGAPALIHRTVHRGLAHEAAWKRLPVRIEPYGTPDEPKEFMRDNRTCAMGLVGALGYALAPDLEASHGLQPPPGRMETVLAPHGPRVVIDFAHDPAGLEAALGALRAEPRNRSGRLSVVFGCGGNRDPGKRREMGAVASRLADRVYVTDDNPRGEAPVAIRRQILAGAPGATEVAGRADAIRRALSDAGRNDTVLLAGMGHQRWEGEASAGSDRAFVERILGDHQCREAEEMPCGWS